MGRVFTPEELQSGNVPRTGGHAKAADYIMEVLFGPEGIDNPPYPMLTSGMVYGSAQLGTPGPRSDLDILFNYSADANGTALRAIGSVVADAVTQFRVPIEVKPLYEGALNSPLEHDIDLDFAHHLQTVARNGRPEWVRGDPLPENLVETCSQYSLLEYALFYCSRKVRSIAKKMASAPGGSEDTLHEVLELPGAICRKVFPAVMDPEHDGEFSYEESKRAVLSKTVDWAERNGQGNLVPDLSRLAGMNTEYTRLLDLTLAGTTSIGEYGQWLDENRTVAGLLGHTVATQWVDLLREKITQT
jgi:hypothetical protein